MLRRGRLLLALLYFQQAHDLAVDLEPPPSPAFGARALLLRRMARVHEKLGHFGHARALFEASLEVGGGGAGGGGDVGPPPQEAAGTTAQAHHRQLEALREEFTHILLRLHRQLGADSDENDELLRGKENRVGSFFVGLHSLLDHVYADWLKALNPSGLSDKTDLLFLDYTSRATMEAKARKRRVWPGVLRATGHTTLDLGTIFSMVLGKAGYTRKGQWTKKAQEETSSSSLTRDCWKSLFPPRRTASGCGSWGR